MWEEFFMLKQERYKPRREAPGTEEAKANPKTLGTGKKLTADVDKLVEEIDDALETNAEEFVRNFVQKGQFGRGISASPFESQPRYHRSKGEPD
jgi:prokaryotic ubiquitin-like protein Pup